ncbi:FkbM family methyltransferase [Patulibacter minatonensis]|uniref:FkbM family methyltransferase n=1 Tax=Patulibacter minatonensis TaxID=298163 RepID=UPI0004BACD6B|nr:FkbM family methyltransferase [Patulibacter minatonensis]
MALAGSTIERISTVSDRLGVGDHLRRGYRLVSRHARRNNQDNVNLGLLLAHGLAVDANCVDVGAHTGTVLQDIVRYAPQGTHLAFEPLPAQAQILRERFPGVEVREAAVSDEAGSALFTHVRQSPELSGLRDRGHGGDDKETIEVAVERLDDVVDPDRRVSFVKIDVEGGELGVLKGAKELLLRDRPTIAFEHGVGGSEHFGATSSDIHDFLIGEVGYRLFDIDGNGPLSRDEFQALFTEMIWFFVAHP